MRKKFNRGNFCFRQKKISVTIVKDVRTPPVLQTKKLKSPMIKSEWHGISKVWWLNESKYRTNEINVEKLKAVNKLRALFHLNCWGNSIGGSYYGSCDCFVNRKKVTRGVGVEVDFKTNFWTICTPTAHQRIFILFSLSHIYQPIYEHFIRE